MKQFATATLLTSLLTIPAACTEILADLWSPVQSVGVRRAASGGRPEFDARSRVSLNRQGITHFIGVRRSRVEAGLVEIEQPFRQNLTPQHDFIHVGIATTVADSGGGYAGLTRFRLDTSVLTVEFK